MEVKQTIVMRRDLKMRRGKEIAQGAHASMIWLSERLERFLDKPLFSREEKVWLTGSFAKIVLQVNSEDELMEIYNKAKDKGLTVFLVTDSGKTEFKGVPTRTCLAIGPHEAEKIDEITKTLKLY